MSDVPQSAAMDPSANPPRRGRRRWFQFSVRALLIVTLLVAVALAWQRERLSRWVDSFWRQPTAEMEDTRDPGEVLSAFLRLLASHRREEADKFLSVKARKVTR